MTRFDKFNPIILTKDEAIQRIRNRFGRIYIIKAEGLNCKIGTAKDIKSRKGTLQTGNERNLEVLYQSVPMKNSYSITLPGIWTLPCTSDMKWMTYTRSVRTKQTN